MADLHQIITLGLGTPASIPYFLTVGLGIGDEVVVATPQILTGTSRLTRTLTGDSAITLTETGVSRLTRTVSGDSTYGD